MAYTVPTAAQFKARHLRFASVADGTADAYLAEAAGSVGSDWSDADGPVGIMYLAAHLMIMEGALAPDGVSPGVGNQIKKVKAGDVETEFAVDASTGKGFEATIYGERFRELAGRNGAFAGILVV